MCPSGAYTAENTENLDLAQARAELLSSEQPLTITSLANKLNALPPHKKALFQNAFYRSWTKNQLENVPYNYDFVQKLVFLPENRPFLEQFLSLIPEDKRANVFSEFIPTWGENPALLEECSLLIKTVKITTQGHSFFSPEREAPNNQDFANEEASHADIEALNDEIDTLLDEAKQALEKYKKNLPIYSLLSKKRARVNFYLLALNSNYSREDKLISLLSLFSIQGGNELQKVVCAASRLNHRTIEPKIINYLNRRAAIKHDGHLTLATIVKKNEALKATINKIESMVNSTFFIFKSFKKFWDTILPSATPENKDLNAGNIWVKQEIFSTAPALSPPPPEPNEEPVLHPIKSNEEPHKSTPITRREKGKASALYTQEDHIAPIHWSINNL